MTELGRAMAVRCETCGARPGQPCDESQVRGSLEGVHSKRMNLALNGPAAARDGKSERDEYNSAVRSRVTGEKTWRRR